jgi:hypothetical protein
MSADTDMVNKVARAMRQAMTAVDCGGEGSEFVAFIDIEAGARAALDASGIGEMVEALEKCRHKFLHYEELHRLKCTAEGDEKADRNREMADMCDTALSRARATQSGEG